METGEGRAQLTRCAAMTFCCFNIIFVHFQKYECVATLCEWQYVVDTKVPAKTNACTDQSIN